jgi:hypothetical protein
VAELVALIDAEGIADQVTWSDELTQRQVLEEYRKADIVFEQFGTSLIGMAGFDAMATARPLIAHGRPECLDPAVGVPSPICQATTPEEVCAQLVRLAGDPVARARVGQASYDYVKAHFSAERAAQICLARLASPVAAAPAG